MKSMNGRFFLKKMRLLPSLNTLKHTLVSHHHHHHHQIPSLYKQENQIIDSKDEEEEEEAEFELNFRENKEKNTPTIESTDKIVMEGQVFSLEEEYSSLSNFEEKCPPGGKDSIILYTTSLRSIRKTFEDCHTILFLLESFKVRFYERDVSMDLEFREELWRILGGRVIPPRLFIKGRYIGGADEVVSLHEQGKLKKLLEGIPLLLSNAPCASCANKRFVVCFNCNGSHKVFIDGDHSDEIYIRCPDCNENGLVKCTICS